MSADIVGQFKCLSRDANASLHHMDVNIADEYVVTHMTAGQICSLLCPMMLFYSSDHLSDRSTAHVGVGVRSHTDTLHRATSVGEDG